MNGYWFAANVVLGLHMSLFVVLAVGLVAAALGVLRQHPRLALAFWGTLLATAIWQPLPSCIFTDVEKWLRHLVEPEWDRTISAQRMLIRELAGVDVPERVFWWLGLVMAIAAVSIFWKHHRDQGRVAFRWLLRRSRRA